jgi:hypothetical protein
VFTPCNLKLPVVVQMSLKEWLTLGLEGASEVKLHQLKSVAGVNTVSWCTAYLWLGEGRRIAPHLTQSGGKWLTVCQVVSRHLGCIRGPQAHKETLVKKTAGA